MKLKFIAYWNTDEEIYNFINDIWNVSGEYDDILTYENDYTHLVVYNKTHISFNKHNTIGIVIEPYWSPNFDKNLPDKCQYVLTCQSDKYPNNKNCISKPLLGTHRLYDCHYHGEIICKKDTTKNILNNNYIKTKKLSIIINNHNISNEPENNYLNRYNLVMKLLDSDLDFDMYGVDWNLSDSRYKGFLSNKINGIKDYEYSICLENSNINGYITEKFIDAILCNTIPIYNGAPDVLTYYPNSCEWLNYGNEIQNIKDIINSNKTYLDYDLDGARNLYLYEYNPIKIIKELYE